MADCTSSTMYRTLTVSLGTVFMIILLNRIRGDAVLKETDPLGQLGGDPLERRIAVGFTGRVGDAPVDRFGVIGEAGEDLSYPVAQCDHVVEALPGELVEVPRALTRQVDA